jgi:septal ring factor EnvC (AmiA/AmiB activator)
MSLEQLFGQLEDLILNSPKVPLTNKIIIDEDRLIDLIDHIRQDLPSEFRHAQEIVSQRDAVLAEAQREAEASRANAERQRQQLVSDHEIYRLAQMEADRLVRDAHIQIHEQQQHADQYADEVLAELENKIARALQTIKNGRQYLASPRN